VAKAKEFHGTDKPRPKGEKVVTNDVSHLHTTAAPPKTENAGLSAGERRFNEVFRSGIGPEKVKIAKYMPVLRTREV
jgi:hypothetical protein